MRPIAIRRSLAGWFVLLIALAALALWIGWIGFIASDDALYFAGARHWLVDGPTPGADHWATRLPLMWLFAAVIALVGQNFVAFALTALIPYAALVALTAAATARVGGASAGRIAALLTATLPVVITNATTVSVDLLESCLLVGGAMLLSTRDLGETTRGLLAGLCFGLAIVCRETSLLALAGLAPLFLLGRPVPRRTLLAAAAGIALVLGAEAIFQWSMTGDPLRRYAIAFHHDEHIDRAANMEGNFLLHPAIDPLLVLLVNDDFGLLFWLAIVAAAQGGWRRIDAAGRGRLAVLAAMAAASFLLVAALVHKLVLNPRYFLLPALAAVILVACWLDRLAPRRRFLLLAATIGSDLLLLGLGNAHPRWTMEAIVDAVRTHPGEAVSGDAVDVRRAALPLDLAGLPRARYAPAAPGGLEVVPAAAAPVGMLVRRYPSPPTRVGAVVEALHLVPLVPGPIRRRLLSPSPEVILIRRPPAG